MHRCPKSVPLAAIFLIAFATSDACGQWIDSLPRAAKESILWSADHEYSGLKNWTPDAPNGGGGIFNTGGQQASATLSDEHAHSGKYSVQTRIEGAYQARNGNRAVRLMRWTNKAWSEGGKNFPKTAYYSTWILFPKNYNSNKYSPWDPGDGGWWNVFQFKAHDKAEESQPAWSLQTYFDDQRKCMYFGLYSSIDSSRSVEPAIPRPIAVNSWVHVEALYSCSPFERGQIAIWQDGQKILEAKNVQTVFRKEATYPVWGIGNYTDHVASSDDQGSATIYFDDCVVSTDRISKYLHQQSRSQQ